jgi:hypothetical protein
LHGFRTFLHNTKPLSVKGLGNPEQNGVHLMDTKLNNSSAGNCTDAHEAAQLFAQPAQLAAQSGAQPAHILEGEIVEEDGSPSSIGHGAPYTSQELAQELGVAESTVRTRWLPWIQKVAPVELLADGRGYTELARWRSRP